MVFSTEFQRYPLVAFFNSAFYFNILFICNAVCLTRLISTTKFSVFHPIDMDNIFSPLDMDQAEDNSAFHLSQFYDNDTNSGKRSRNDDIIAHMVPSNYILLEIDMRSIDPSTYLLASHPFANVSMADSIRSFWMSHQPSQWYITSLSPDMLTSTYNIPTSNICIISNPTANSIIHPRTTQAVWLLHQTPPLTLNPTTTLFKTPVSQSTSSTSTITSPPLTSSVDSHFFLSTSGIGKKVDSLPVPTSWPPTTPIHDFKLSPQQGFGSPVQCEWILITNIHLENEDSTVTDILYLCHTIGHSIPYAHVLAAIRNPHQFHLLPSGYMLWLRVLPFHTSNMLGTRGSTIIPEFIIAPVHLHSPEVLAINKSALQRNLSPHEGLSIMVQAIPVFHEWRLLGVLAYCPLQQAVVLMLLQAIRDICPEITAIFVVEKMFRRDFKASDSSPAIHSVNSDHAKTIRQVGGSHFRHGAFYLLGPLTYSRSVKGRFRISTDPSLIRIGGVVLGTFESRSKLFSRPCPPPHANSTLYTPVLRFVRQSLPRADLFSVLLSQPFNIPLFYRLEVEVSYGPETTDTIILFPFSPHVKTQSLVLSSDTELFIDRDAATQFKKK